MTNFSVFTLIILWFVVVSVLTGIYLHRRNIGAGPKAIYYTLVVIQTLWWAFLINEITNKSTSSSDPQGNLGGDAMVWILFSFLELIYTFILLIIVAFCEIRHRIKRSKHSKSDGAE